MKAAAQTPTEAILESISDGVFTVDLDWIITSFNRAAQEITGVPRDQALGRHCADVFRSNMCEKACALRQTMRTGRPIIGVAGYIVNSLGERVPVSVSTALLRNAAGKIIGGAETFRDLSEVEVLREELEGRARLGDMTSKSASMQSLFADMPAVAASPSTVLILGETGTGKELLARTIHALSPRNKGPFVAVNCGALPDTLLESELFGYKSGAFSGAVSDKPGRFSLAKGGTLLLDEIGEITPALQIRLLRVLQERCFEPLGAVKSEEADVRIIAATNRNLEDMVAQGSFRQDLYYRINVVRCELPPLRKRKEDIPLLVAQFIERFNCLQHKTVQGVTGEALSLLVTHHWPGNIRELENAIERAFILCADGLIDIRHLPPELRTLSAPSENFGDVQSAHDMLDAQAIHAALERNLGNRLAAARELGIHKTTLYRRMKRLGLALPKK